VDEAAYYLENKFPSVALNDSSNVGVYMYPGVYVHGKDFTGLKWEHYPRSSNEKGPYS
jgi:hypothetical protein